MSVLPSVRCATLDIDTAEASSSGRALTPQSGVHFSGMALRTEADEIQLAFNRLREQCALPRRVLKMSSTSTYAHSFIAQGLLSAVFLYANVDVPTTRFAVKFNKHGVWSPTSSPKRVCSVDALEIDATIAVWYMMAARGLSPHVPRPYGVLPFGWDDSALPYAGLAKNVKIDGLLLECMSGITLPDGSRVLDMKQVIVAGLAGKMVGPDGADEFEQLLVTLLFQVLFTIAMWNASTGNSFRHNDLHLSNVCVTYWNAAHTPVEVEYRLPGPDGSVCVFVLNTPYCATVIDFGYSALLPRAGGPVFDPRFYFFDTNQEKLTRDPKSFNGVQETKFVKWGLSHRQESKHYDSLLFMFATLLQFGRSKHPVADGFRTFYSRCFGNVHLSDRFMFKKDCSGRLTPEGQRKLMEGKPVTIGTRVLTVLDPVAALMDPFFARFRGMSTLPSRQFVYGLDPSPAAVSGADSLVTSRTISSLAHNPCDVKWKPVFSAKGVLTNLPKPGLWSSITRRLDALKAAASAGVAMTPVQAAAWTGTTLPVQAPIPVPDSTDFDWDTVLIENL